VIVVMLVLGIFVMIVVRFVTEEGALQFLGSHSTTGCCRQVEQRQGFFKLTADCGDLGLVSVSGGGMLEPHQIHRRTFQLQLQGLAVQRRVQAPDAVLVGAEAAMLMVVIMFVGGMSDSQRQQGKRQGEKQAAHGESPKDKMKKMLCNLITLMRGL
jgi:hypothetical protein